MFISNFETMLKIIFMSVLFYFALIIILRISGKRTLSDINAFDFLVTVTIGSIGATTILSKDTAFFDGVVGIVTLILLQYIISKLDTKFDFIGEKLIPTPTLLFYNGEYIKENMEKMRVTKANILQKVRLKSGTVIENVSAVVLEANGELSVIGHNDHKI